jgi:hypothetical protein
MQSLRFVIVLSAVFLLAGLHNALAQRCPPNSHPAAVAIPGNLRTAQCFCNAGYVPVRGVCVRAATPKPPSDPSKALVQPQPR